MESASTMITTDDGRKVELGAFTSEGHTFTAHGYAECADGSIMAYIGDRQWETFGSYAVTTWGGERIGWASKVHSWEVCPPGAYHPVKMIAYQATINGRRYHGRHAPDAGDLIHWWPLKA